MKFTATQENLTHALSKISPIAGRNTQLPILQNVLLKTQSSALEITATDLEVGGYVSVGGKVEDTGTCAVPARLLFNYVNQLPSDHPITIEVKKGGLLVSTKSHKATLPVSDSSDFPPLPSAKSDVVVSIPTNALIDTVQRVLFSAARDETRQEIRSVYVRKNGTELIAAATDSFRLAEARATIKGDDDFAFLLPLSAAQEVGRLFAGGDEVSLSVHENYIVFQSSGVQFSTRLVEGNYPDYEQIIPKKHETRVTINTKALEKALKTVEVLLPRDSRRVQLIITSAKPAGVHVSVAGLGGDGDVKIDADIDGESQDVLINVQYLLEGLQRIGTEECVVELGGMDTPVVFRPTESKDKFVYVVMPIQPQV